MKNIPIQDLVIGDVFAKEIKLKGREAFEVTFIDVANNKLEAKKRGALNPQKMQMKNGQTVYWLRNALKDLEKNEPKLF
jgi:hypothetical protein